MNRARAAVAAFALVVAVLGMPSAYAYEGDASSIPGDGSVLLSTPREVVVTLDEVPAGPVVLELRDADSGAIVPFTGGDPVVSGLEVRAYPPALEPGTYTVRWSYESGSGPRQGMLGFSVGTPSAAVVTFGEGPATAVAGYLGVVLVLLGSVALALAVVSWSRRRSRVAPLSISALATVAVVVLSTPVPMFLRAIALLSALSAALACFLRPRVGLSCSGTLLAFVGGFLMGFAGPIPLVSGPLAGLGGLSTAVLLGAGLAFAVSPGRARVVARRVWPALVVAALLLPAAWAGAWLAREADFQDHFAAAASLVAAIALGVLAFLLASATAVLILRRRARASVVTSASGAALLAVSMLLLVPASPDEASSRVLEFDASGSAQQCLGQGDRLSTTVCLQGLFAAKAKQSGVTPTLDQLRDAMTQTPALRFFCHETAHSIGRASLAVHDGKVSEAFSDGYDVCDFGYYHGIIEAAAGTLSDAEFADAVPTLCAELASVDRLFFLQCTHGLGHAAARRANNDLVRALEFCDRIDGSPAYPEELLPGALNACGTGVTMEWFAVAGATGGADGSAVSPAVDSLRDVCLAVPDRWQPECLEYVGNTLDTGRPKESLLELASWCLATAYPSSCFHGLARAAGGVGLAPQDAIEVCGVAGPGRRECLQDYLLTVATTIEYDAAAVDRICELLPSDDRSGKDSLCVESRRLAEEILAATDGKTDPSDPGFS